MPTLKHLLLLCLMIVILIAPNLAHADEPGATAEPPTPSEPQFTPWDLIERVNDLRVASGLAVLQVHPVLMQVAQIEASGIAAGYGGHWRPNNLSLGQWLLTLGYPLSGDLSMDGYRSENWFTADLSSTSEDVTGWWQVDTEHSDTMFSEFRSDIGAALAVGEDGQVYVVLETALRTTSGKMQSDAYPILTGVPQTQAAYAGMATQAAANGLLPQYSMAVRLSTPQADGKLYHVVQYGQTLWSIAIAYHTTIRDIQALNNLSSSYIREGQKLLVRNSDAQMAPTSSAGGTPRAQDAIPVPSHLAPPTVERPAGHAPSRDRGMNTLSFGYPRRLWRCGGRNRGSRISDGRLVHWQIWKLCIYQPPNPPICGNLGPWSICMSSR
jgi:LysM repeat protein